MTRAAFERMTRRQLEVLDTLVRGLTAKEAARELGISPKTIECHIGAMFAALGVNRRAHVIRLYYEAGLGAGEIT